MKSLISILILMPTVLVAGVSPRIEFDKRCYEVTILKEGIYKMQQMILNKHTNYLYFVTKPISGYLEIDTGIARPINSIKFPKSVYIDERTGTVFIEGHKGLYRLYNGSIPVLIHARKNNYSVYDKKLNQSEIFGPIFQLGDVDPLRFVFDDKFNIFFIRGNYLHRYNINSTSIVVYTTFKARVIARDNFKRVFVASDDYVYASNKDTSELEAASDLTNIRALAFSRTNEPIITILDTIYKLKLLNVTNCDETSEYESDDEILVDGNLYK